jgi:hypothetical protein
MWLLWKNVTEVSSREEEYSIYGPVLNFGNFEVIVRQIIHSNKLSPYPNMFKYSKESKCKTAIAMFAKRIDCSRNPSNMTMQGFVT